MTDTLSHDAFIKAVKFDEAGLVPPLPRAMPPARF